MDEELGFLVVIFVCLFSFEAVELGYSCIHILGGLTGNLVIFISDAFIFYQFHPGFHFLS